MARIKRTNNLGYWPTPVTPPPAAATILPSFDRTVTIGGRQLVRNSRLFIDMEHSYANGRARFLPTGLTTGRTSSSDSINQVRMPRELLTDADFSSLELRIEATAWRGMTAEFDAAMLYMLSAQDDMNGSSRRAAEVAARESQAAARARADSHNAMLGIERNIALGTPYEPTPEAFGCVAQTRYVRPEDFNYYAARADTVQPLPSSLLLGLVHRI